MAGNGTEGRLLGATAYWTAAVRAREHEREDRLIDDPWAAALAGDLGEAWMAQRTPESVVPIVLRTRYFDDWLQRITAEHGIRQVVLLAAGLDPRAYRLPWPEQTRAFELDQPAVLAHKAQVLDAAGAVPGCERRPVPVDLTGSWQAALVAAGFDPLQPSVWLLEGFLFYLPSNTVTRLLADLTPLGAPDSWLGFDIVNSITLTSPLTHKWIEMQAAADAPWIGTLDDPAGYLSGLGWTASLSQAGQPDANHGRWPYPIIPTNMPNMPHNWFVTASKSAAPV